MLLGSLAGNGSCKPLQTTAQTLVISARSCCAWHQLHHHLHGCRGVNHTGCSIPGMGHGPTATCHGCGHAAAAAMLRLRLYVDQGGKQCRQLLCCKLLLPGRHLLLLARPCLLLLSAVLLASCCTMLTGTAGSCWYLSIGQSAQPAQRNGQDCSSTACGLANQALAAGRTASQA